MKMSHIPKVVKERWKNKEIYLSSDATIVDSAQNDIFDLLDYIKELESLINKEIDEPTVGNLIDELNEVDLDRLVVLSCDSEGNCYRPLDLKNGFCFGAYSESEYDFLSDEDLKEIKFSTPSKRAIVLYPK